MPKIFRDDFFLREWDHLCPRYLGVMFNPSGTICAQNVTFYIEATLSVHGEIILPVCCFPTFPQLFAFPYTYFHLTCSFLLACRFSPKWDDLCPRYSEMIFHANGTIRGDFLTEVRVSPFVPGAICARNFNRGDFLHPVAWDHLFPKRTILPENNLYCGEVICQLVVVFPCFSFVCFCLYIFFIQLFACMSVPLVFFFQMCSSRGSGANSLPHSRIICSHELVASRKQCLHQKRKVPFVLIWLILRTRSFAALSNGFCHMPANTFHVAAYLQCLILKQILLLLHLMLFTVSTGFNAWPVCRGFLILSFLL